MASVQAHAVVEGVLALRLALVSRVGDPAVRLEEHGGAEVLFLVPPVRGAGCGAAGAEDAFVESVELLAVFLCLTEFTALRELVSCWIGCVGGVWRLRTSGAGVSRCR